MSGVLVSVVLPVHNQADHITTVVRAYQAALSAAAIDHEIILVENASTDGSFAACTSLANGPGSTVRVLHEDRGGWGRAVRLGLREARGGVLCYTNSARTTPDELALMVRYALANPDVVVKANRKIRESWVRRLGSLLYNIECRVLFDLPSWDINGTPKVFGRSLDALANLKRDDDLIDLEFVVACRRADYPLLEVPVASSPRHGGRSTTGYLSALRLYVGAFKLSRDLKSTP